MRLGNIVAASALLLTTLAWPGMGKTLEELRTRDDSGDSTELIGDLAYTPDDQLTPTAKLIKSIITGGASGETSDTYPNVPIKGTSACKADTCCIWQYVANDMALVFRGASGRCTGLARGAVRLGFHDAAGWSKNTGKGGGADGSIILAPVEMTRGENNGLQEIVAQMNRWYARYKDYGVGMADLIQMGANVATVVCPLGPRIRSFVGRKDSNVACTDGLLPGVNQDADALIQLFQDKTIQPHGLTALIGAHTTSQQRFVDPARAGDPQDSTPGVWDVLFYKQTLGQAPPRVFKFQSDVVLSQDPRINPEFTQFAGPGGQEHWNEDYAREYVRLSLLGVYNINNLTDCSKVLPPARTSYSNPDQAVLDKWLASTKHSDPVAKALRDGSLITNLLNAVLALVGKIRREVTFAA